MANIPVNPTGIVASTSVTGSFAGFTVVTTAATFSAILDANGGSVGAMTLPIGTTVNLFVTSASFTGGPVLFYT
jgi:hypothetical protein